MGSFFRSSILVSLISFSTFASHDWREDSFSDGGWASADVKKAAEWLQKAKPSSEGCAVSAIPFEKGQLLSLALNISGPKGAIFSGEVAGTGGNLHTGWRTFTAETQEYPENDPSKGMIRTFITIHKDWKGRINKVTVVKKLYPTILPTRWKDLPKTIESKVCP